MLETWSETWWCVVGCLEVGCDLVPSSVISISDKFPPKRISIAKTIKLKKENNIIYQKEAEV